MTILETTEFSLIQRVNVIYANVDRTTNSLPLTLVYQMLDSCDDIAREFFPRDLSEYITNTGTVSFRIGTEINEITTQEATGSDVIHHIIQVSNQLASILLLTGINSSQNNQIILNRTDIYKEIIKGFNAISDFQKNTSIQQLGGLTRRALGTFG